MMRHFIALLYPNAPGGTEYACKCGCRKLGLIALTDHMRERAAASAAARKGARHR